jgi:hypothetical protein
MASVREQAAQEHHRASCNHSRGVAKGIGEVGTKITREHRKSITVQHSATQEHHKSFTEHHESITSEHLVSTVVE